MAKKLCFSSYGARLLFKNLPKLGKLFGPPCFVKSSFLRPGNDWAQGTTDIWDNDFLGSCERFSVTSRNSEVEIDFLLSGRDHIQVEHVH
jgi:hypothetical protein